MIEKIFEIIFHSIAVCLLSLKCVNPEESCQKEIVRANNENIKFSQVDGNLTKTYKKIKKLIIEGIRAIRTKSVLPKSRFKYFSIKN